MPLLHHVLTNRAALTGLLLCGALLTGCSSQPTRDPRFAATRPPPPNPVAARTDGAILSLANQPAQFYNVALFTDTRAHNVGDILTVRLEESTAATKDSETKLEQTSDFAVTNPTVFGVTPSIKLPSITKNLTDRVLTQPANGRFDLSANINGDKNFDGKGESLQSNSLSGEITVSVSEVLANGNLRVRGEKQIAINQGTEFIRFSGVVNPRAITGQNTVPSTQVADARIEYVGDGYINEAQHMGWLQRFFLNISPF